MKRLHESAQLTASFPCEHRSVPRARQFVVEAVTALGKEAHGDLAELVVSELVTNAVTHALSPVDVLVQECGEQSVCITVRDLSPRPPALQEPNGSDHGGRGLLLVDSLASAWGSHALPGGKLVWFCLSTDDECCELRDPLGGHPVGNRNGQASPKA